MRSVIFGYLLGFRLVLFCSVDFLSRARVSFAGFAGFLGRIFQGFQELKSTLLSVTSRSSEAVLSISGRD